MNRAEAIQRIVWVLLAHADTPWKAVAAAKAVRSGLGPRAEGDFRNLLRAAGLFAYDDDGFFVRYARGNGSQPAINGFRTIPDATHVLTVPVPVEPRMRIAYSVFAGLLLKYLYQRYRAVPIQVAEGMALLWVPEASSLPEAGQVWKEFQVSDLTQEALRDGIEATLSAVGNIGAIALTDSLATGSILHVLLDVLPSYERKFQEQGGMRLDFFLKEDVEAWRRGLGVSQRSHHDDTVERAWTRGLRESDSTRAAKKIAVLLLDEAIEDTTRPMPFRSVPSLWRGEGAGNVRKTGYRDRLGWKPRVEWNDIGPVVKVDKAKQVDGAVVSALALLERRRRTTRDLDRWVDVRLRSSQDYNNLVDSIADRLKWMHDRADEREIDEQYAEGDKMGIDASYLVDEITTFWQDETLIPFINSGEIRSALKATLANLLAWRLAQRTEAVDIAIFGWSVGTLRSLPEDRRFALRFLNKSDPPNAKRVLEIPPFGAVVRCSGDRISASAPCTLTPLSRAGSSMICTVTVPSRGRCVICGGVGELSKGAKSFLPESKKRWYESPSSEAEPKLCGNCAFIAYLSAVYPSDNVSVAEFPADNFLELFALYEHLQGVSGAVALKVVNRIATLAILPSRYLLLSKHSRRGRMDAKTQIYAQLRNHVPLLQDLDRPIRVQIEGTQPNFWSEIHPHVAVGLSHFARFPSHYQSDRKVAAQHIVRSLVGGRPFAALYLAVQDQPEADRGWERNVLTRGLRAFEAEFVMRTEYAARMVHALGGARMRPDFYEDVIELSNYLLDLVRPLVQKEVERNHSAVSGVARKYTALISRDFADGRAAKFLYAVCQEADWLERNGHGWAKRQSLDRLYGGRPAVEGKSGEEAVRLWSAFRDQHPRTVLETRIQALRVKHGRDVGSWSKFLDEVQARTLALLMLNVRNPATR